MKYILILSLAFAVSCTTKKKDNNPASEPATTTAAPAGESNAKPVSPYTVQPCYCMKIFQPVCAEGRNFGNSCEAECNGHKKWTEGSCAEKKK